MTSPAHGEFFQAMRLKLSAARRAGKTRAALGQSERLASEPVRLKAATGMRYPSNEIAEVRIIEGAKPEFVVGFMGLTGPSGVLPDHYTDLLVERRRARDPALAEFLDLFNHRIISLFYRAWVRSRLPVRFEEAPAPFRDPISRSLAALVGLGLESQHGRAAQQDGALLGMAGLLGRRVRTPHALRSLVVSLLAFDCSVEEFQGQWLPIADSERTRLMQPRPGMSTFSRLGVDAVAGEKVWDVQGRFRLRLGPMGLKDFLGFFTPDGSMAKVRSAVREVIGPSMHFDVKLVLRREDVPTLRLGDPSQPAFLGQTTWLCTTTPSQDRDDAVLSGA
jgi:type VI secretion system protein ImpH